MGDIQPFDRRDKADNIAIPDFTGMRIDLILRNIVMRTGIDFLFLRRHYRDTFRIIFQLLIAIGYLWVKISGETRAY